MTTTLNPDFILSDPSLTITGMSHPWRRLRDALPDWDVVFAVPKRAGVIGETNIPARTITLHPGMLQAQRRTCLAHELHHAENGDDCVQHRHREAAINQAVARDLLPIDLLLDKARWARSLWELADECWVDVATMRIRLDHLHPSERAAMARVVRSRENDEEPE